MTLFDIISMGEARLLQNQTDARVSVEFRLAVFQPFVGEILNGVIIHSTGAGIRVRVLDQLFEDVFIPPSNLPPHSYFADKEQLWVWPSQQGELFYERGITLRFKVDSVFYGKPQYDAPKETPKTPGVEDTEPIVLPLLVIGSLDDQHGEKALGHLEWWACSLPTCTTPTVEECGEEREDQYTAEDLLAEESAFPDTSILSAPQEEPIESEPAATLTAIPEPQPAESTTTQHPPAALTS